jgi:hypothetical protein
MRAEARYRVVDRQEGLPQLLVQAPAGREAEVAGDQRRPRRRAVEQQQVLLDLPAEPVERRAGQRGGVAGDEVGRLAEQAVRPAPARAVDLQREIARVAPGHRRQQVGDRLPGHRGGVGCGRALVMVALVGGQDRRLQRQLGLVPRRVDLDQAIGRERARAHRHRVAVLLEGEDGERHAAASRAAPPPVPPVAAGPAAGPPHRSLAAVAVASTRPDDARGARAKWLYIGGGTRKEVDTGQRRGVEPPADPTTRPVTRHNENA